MKKYSFKKLLALVTMLTMVLTLVAVPNVSANADETKGEVNYANDYDGTANEMYVFASENATTCMAKLASGTAGMFGWWSGVLLEKNAQGNYVVTKADVATDGTLTVERTPLGAGKIVIVWHSNATAKHQASINFFGALKVNDVLTMSATWETLAAASGELTTPISFTKATNDTDTTTVTAKAPTQAALNVANGLGASGEEGTKICVLKADNAAMTLNLMTANAPTGMQGLPYWYSIVLEKNAEKGTWVVKVSDLVDGNGINDCAGEALGEGRILIAYHAAATDAQAVAFFYETANVGQEYYLVGEIPTVGSDTPATGVALTDVYLTTVKPADPAPNPGTGNESGSGSGSGNESGSGTGTGTGSGNAQTPTNPNMGDFGTTTTVTMLVAGIALAAAALVLKKRYNVA